MAPLRATIMICSALALAACDDFDIDLRPGAANTSGAVQTATSPRPEPDANGIIPYPNYQVAVARRGDTVMDVAERVGLTPEELATFNGIRPADSLREGEILALPRTVGTPADDTIDITTIAGGAIERAEGQGQVGAITPVETTVITDQPEPIRHQVVRGETAYSIARLYDVSVTSLAEWNGLGPDLAVREGQYLLIPVAVDGFSSSEAAAPVVVADASEPGGTSIAPPPPSASTPLPADDTVAAAEVITPESPDLAAEQTVTAAQMAFPVNGSIIREYAKGSNEGIDISAPVGTAVKAAAAGTVAAITRDTDQVPILVIRHDGDLLTVYANIDEITVEKGDPVSRGQTVAKVRASDPSFLHFEVRDGFESVDPIDYLQ